MMKYSDFHMMYSGEVNINQPPGNGYFVNYNIHITIEGKIILEYIFMDRVIVKINQDINMYKHMAITSGPNIRLINIHREVVEKKMLWLYQSLKPFGTQSQITKILKHIKSYYISDKITIEQRIFKYKSIMKLLPSKFCCYKKVYYDVFVLVGPAFQICDVFINFDNSMVLSVELNKITHNSIYIVYLKLCTSVLNIKVSKDILRTIYNIIQNSTDTNF